jgi:hypothetical protein
LIMRNVSPVILKRFPTLRHVVEAGILTESELQRLEVENDSPYGIYWIPGCWFNDLVRVAHEKVYIFKYCL